MHRQLGEWRISPSSAEGFNGPRIGPIIALTAACALALAGSAIAASQTVQGSGDIDKMAVNNAKRALKVNLFGLGPPCEAQYMKVVVDWGTKAGYQIENGCFSGTWAKALAYLPDRSVPESAEIVECPKLRFKYAAASKSHRARVPRSCIPKAGNRLRVRSTGHDFGTLTGGEAGPTRRLKRG